MKKITLSVALLASVLAMKAQDTTCTYFTGDRVLEFDYYMDTVLYEVKQITKYYDIEVKYGDVLCLDLSDHKNRVRKVITTFFDGSTHEDVLDSKDYVYYSPQGTEKVSVSKPKLVIKL
mgnify:CR=1 FL=1